MADRLGRAPVFFVGFGGFQLRSWALQLSIRLARAQGVSETCLACCLNSLTGTQSLDAVSVISRLRDAACSAGSAFAGLQRRGSSLA